METIEHAAETTVKGMDGPGWSNSEPVGHAPDDVHPELAPLEPQEPGFTNPKAVTVSETTSPVAAPDHVEDKARKTTKTTPRKG